MRHLDLFSGIGGFALATERVWPQIEHTFCEIDPFCQEVLKKHWPKAKIYGDIRTLTNARGKESRGLSSKPRQENKTPWQPYILTGGFPCQPFSQAGRRKGTEDDRYLWPEMLRVIREFTPVWVIGENVGGFVTWNDGMVLRQVFSDLEGEGYEVQAFIIPAVSVNAPHRRDRIWIVAYSKKSEQKWSRDTRTRRKRFTDSTFDDTKGKQIKSAKQERFHPKSSSPNWNQNWIEVAAKLCRVDDGLPKRLDRNPRLKALGNAIVPQVAEEIFKAISLIK